MRKILFLSVILISSISLFSQNSLSTSINKYSIDLYKDVIEDDKNEFISPLSTFYALMMVYEGSDNNTKKQFEEVFYLSENKALKDLKTFTDNLYSNSDSNNRLIISNALWLNQNFALKKEYKTEMKNKFNASTQKMDFGKSQESADIINQWCSDKTEGLIDKIVGPDMIDPGLALVLTNAIYFIAEWKDVFDSSFTQKRDFYLLDKTTTEVDMMQKKTYNKYYEDRKIQALALDYKGGDKSFYILLPKKKAGITDLEEEFDYQYFEKIRENMAYTEVNHFIPKFKLETKYSLPKNLIKLGLEDAFTSEADLSGITGTKNLFISDVLHKAYIEIDEKKTEAAAVTAVMVRVTSTSAMPDPPAKIFNADHPFVFMIVDNVTGSIVFMGRYVKSE